MEDRVPQDDRMRYEHHIKAWRARVDSELGHRLPSPETKPNKLHEAMRYSVLNGGKRLRPLLVYATGFAIGASHEALDAPACAVELIHAYSLVHDDLPAMDNDDLRRGRPTCHKIYGDAMAILAGDALQALAFSLLTCNINQLQASSALEMTRVLAAASGSYGMAGGQAMDLDAVGKSLNLTELETMHQHNTGDLIRASIKLGALCQPNIDPDKLEQFDQFGRCIGLAFQIQDDILDIESTTETLGKAQGADRALNKPTYPALLGLETAKQMAQDLCKEGLNNLIDLDERTDPLRELSSYIVQREH